MEPHRPRHLPADPILPRWKTKEAKSLDIMMKDSSTQGPPVAKPPDKSLTTLWETNMKISELRTTLTRLRSLQTANRNAQPAKESQRLSETIENLQRQLDELQSKQHKAQSLPKTTNSSSTELTEPLLLAGADDDGSFEEIHAEEIAEQQDKDFVVINSPEEDDFTMSFPLRDSEDDELLGGKYDTVDEAYRH
jgi:hypothetical protein